MSRKKISQLESATDVTANDLLQIVDVEDGDMAPSGTNKKVTAQTLGNYLPVTATGSTTSRSLANRFADTVNVKDFGAVGDGVTDDTAAIQNALNTGRWVTVPPGKYRTTATLTYTQGSGLIGESSFFWQYVNNAPAIGAASVIFYDGPAGSNTCVVRMSRVVVGTLPTFSANEANTLRNAAIRDIVIDGNGKAEFGLYVARAGLGNIFENIVVCNTKLRGFFFGEFWSCEVGPLLAIHNYGSGGSIGENLFSWGTGNIVNACQFNTLLAFKNGRDATYNESSAPRDGVGWVIGCNRTNTFTNVICELNYGTGLYLFPRTGPNKFTGLYLEDNCYFDPATDAASEISNALTAGRATLPWGMIGYNRKVSADTIQVLIENVFGANVGGTPRYQHIKLTGDASGGFVQEPEEPWVIRGVHGIRTIESDFYNYALEYPQKSLVDDTATGDLTRCLPYAGQPESITSSVTTLFVGNAASGNKSGRDSNNLMLIDDAIACARVCSGVTTVDISARNGTSNPTTPIVLDGRGFTRRLTLNGGTTGRFNFSTGNNVAIIVQDWTPQLSFSELAALDRVIITDSNVELNNCPIVRTGANNDSNPAVFVDRSSIEVNGTTIIDVSNSTAATKIGVSLQGNSTISFNNAAAGTIASYTVGNAIHFNEGSGTVRVSLTTATAVWAAAANVVRNTGGGAGIVLAPNGLNP